MIEKSSDVGYAIGVKFEIAFILLLTLNSYARALKFTTYFVDESRIPPPYLLCLGKVSIGVKIFIEALAFTIGVFNEFGNCSIFIINKIKIY